ncbi:MAG: cysteine hydrolase [Clostridiales bacterium]|nr:cysteine hydrolase [Clostridiales bacterium]
MKLLVVVDMQKDFVDGALGTSEAVAIVPKVRDKILECRAEGWIVVFTRDTHTEEYPETQEGKKLPVIHCIKGTPGWEIVPELSVEDSSIFDKSTFGSMELAQFAAGLPDLDAVLLIGLCTDICVISNALLLKAALPEVRICVDAGCCAGVTPESHKNALAAMEACQIDIRKDRSIGSSSP